MLRRRLQPSDVKPQSITYQSKAKKSSGYRLLSISVIGLLIFVVSLSHILTTKSHTHEKLPQEKEKIFSSTHTLQIITDQSNINCDDTEFSYLGMACASEKVNIELGEKAMFPLSKDSAIYNSYKDGTNTTINKIGIKVQENDCAICKETVEKYNLHRKVYFKKKQFDGTSKFCRPISQFNLLLRIKVYIYGVMGMPSFTYPLQPNDNNRKNFLRMFSWPSLEDASRCPRIQEAQSLFDQAKDEYKNGKLANALTLSSIARTLVHAAYPEELYISEGGMLYNGIVEYNKYFSAFIQSHLAKATKESSQEIHKLSSCPKYMDTSYKELVTEQQLLEPIYHDLRNFDYHELGIPISMNPYRILPSVLPSYPKPNYRKKILIDIGPNGFFGSPKALLDMYAPYQKFDEVHMFEPHSDDMSVPNYYKSEYDIYFHQVYIMAGETTQVNILNWMEENVKEDDFVVLKFDVDEGNGLDWTIEWGFLSDLIHSKSMRLVDELYTELHFHYPVLGWKYFRHHSMQQGYDVIRQLRRCGVAIHAWP